MTAEILARIRDHFSHTKNHQSEAQNHPAFDSAPEDDPTSYKTPYMSLIPSTIVETMAHMRNHFSHAAITSQHTTQSWCAFDSAPEDDPMSCRNP